MTEKRFWSEDYSVGYYTEIVDNDKELTDVPNPKKNLTIEEVVETLNELNDENIQLQKENKKLKSGYDWEFELRIINGVIDEVDHLIDQRINDVLPKRYHQANMYFAAKDELANLKKDIHRKIKD